MIYLKLALNGVFGLNKQMVIEELSIHNFRGLNNLFINDIANVNIFVGTNNCGKTSVLEAIRLLGSPQDVGRLVQVALQRAQASDETKKKNLINYLLSIFQRTVDEEDQQNYYHIKLGAKTNGHQYIYEVDGTIGEVVDSTGSEKRTFDIAIKETDKGSANYQRARITSGEDLVFSSTKKAVYTALYLPTSLNYYRICVELLKDYIVREGKQSVLHVLQTFDDNIDDVSVVEEDIYLHNIHSGSLPLFAYGSGLQKAVFLTTAIVYCKNGVILIDEIDNAIHASAFEDVFSWFLSACLKWNVQAFITTHNTEAIDAILKIVHTEYFDEDVLRVITLRKDYNSNITWKKIRSGKEA